MTKTPSNTSESSQPASYRRSKRHIYPLAHWLCILLVLLTSVGCPSSITLNKPVSAKTAKQDLENAMDNIRALTRESYNEKIHSKDVHYIRIDLLCTTLDRALKDALKVVHSSGNGLSEDGKRTARYNIQTIKQSLIALKKGVQKRYKSCKTAADFHFQTSNVSRSNVSDFIKQSEYCRNYTNLKNMLQEAVEADNARSNSN